MRFTVVAQPPAEFAAWEAAQLQPSVAPVTAKELDLMKTGIFSVCLFASSFTMWQSEAAHHRGSKRCSFSR